MGWDGEAQDPIPLPVDRQVSATVVGPAAGPRSG